MEEQEISTKLKQFIYNFMDSVEQIEVLVFMCKHPDKWFSSTQVSMELSSPPASILNRLSNLEKIGLLESDKNNDLFRFRPVNDELKEISTELSNEYLIRRQAIIELIFSSSKNIKKFADAFIFTKLKKTTGDS